MLIRVHARRIACVAHTHVCIRVHLYTHTHTHIRSSKHIHMQTHAYAQPYTYTTIVLCFDHRTIRWAAMICFLEMKAVSKDISTYIFNKVKLNIFFFFF